MRLDESKLFLTGHRGFIGSVVHGLVPGARVLEGRTPSTAELVEQLADVDCVVHLAGGGGARFCLEHPKEATEGNVVLTHRLVEAAKRAGVKRIVFASSIAVYGTMQVPTNPIAEHHPATPDDLYGSLKLACEEIVKSMPHTILRFSNVYGFGTGRHLDRGGFVNKVCTSARTTGRIELTSSTLAMDFVHVQDAAGMILACATDARSVGAILNVGTGQATRLVDCARLIQKALGVPIEVVVNERPGYRTRYLDIGRAKELVGWQPRVGLSDGITDLLARLT